jgi:hypothetical protein
MHYGIAKEVIEPLLNKTIFPDWLEVLKIDDKWYVRLSINRIVFRSPPFDTESEAIKFRDLTAKEGANLEG